MSANGLVVTAGARGGATAADTRALSGARHAALAVARALAREDVVLYALVVVVGLALAALYAFSFGIYQGDALARTYQAAMVLYVDQPGLANISFIWTPLPALAQVPLLLDERLALNGFSSQIVSVGFAAGALVVLNRIVRPYIASRLPRYLFLAAYQLNPMILVYTVNGMTELVLIFFVLLGVWALATFQREYGATNGAAFLSRRGTVRLLMVMGGAAALAFMSRYEGLVFGVALAAALAVCTLERSHAAVERTEALLIAYAAPFVYAVGMWILANWLVMGDPLYFLIGRGSNKEQAVLALAAIPELAAASGNVVSSLTYVCGLLAHLYPAFFAVAALLLVVAWRHRDRFALGLVLVMGCFPVFQLLLHVLGQSFGYARFHIYVIPLTMIGAAYLGRRLGGVGRGLACALLLTASVSTLSILPEHPVWSANEGAYFRALDGSPVQDRFAPERDMARVLDTIFATQPDARVLFDELRGADLAVFSANFGRFMSSRDRDFAAALVDPGSVVQYVLVSDMPDGGDVVAEAVTPTGQHLELVYETPPELQRPPGTELDKPTGWRLYRVTAMPPA